MKTGIVTVLFITILSFSVPAQELLNIRIDNSCSYYGEEITDQVYGFSSSNEAIDIVNRIVDVVGLKPNFEIKAGNVPNALATIQGGKRLILYSQNFISKINNATGNDWAGISIMAHEVGHHLNGHTIEGSGSRPGLELEADEWSGFVLAKLGASLDEAQSAIIAKGSSQGSKTHPPKSARLEAIAVGWNKGAPGRTPVNTDPNNSGPPPVTRKQEDYPQQSDPQQRNTNTQYAQITIAYSGDLYGCVLPVAITIGGQTFQPTSNAHLVTVPAGRQYYSISGTINCTLIGSCTAQGSGEVNIIPNRFYYLVWQNTSYGQCSIWLATQ